MIAPNLILAQGPAYIAALLRGITETDWYAPRAEPTAKKVRRRINDELTRARGWGWTGSVVWDRQGDNA